MLSVHHLIPSLPWFCVQVFLRYLSLDESTSIDGETTRRHYNTTSKTRHLSRLLSHTAAKHTLDGSKNVYARISHSRISASCVSSRDDQMNRKYCGFNIPQDSYSMTHSSYTICQNLGIMSTALYVNVQCNSNRIPVIVAIISRGISQHSCRVNRFPVRLSNPLCAIVSERQTFVTRNHQHFVIPKCMCRGHCYFLF